MPESLYERQPAKSSIFMSNLQKNSPILGKIGLKNGYGNRKRDPKGFQNH
jgi:hypothetical protein